MQWVTFDCFGTLVDWHSGFASILQPITGSKTPLVLAAYHRAERVAEAERPHRLYRDVLAESLLRAAEQVGAAMSESQARTLPALWGKLPVFADVEPMLAALRESGCRLGVLTNCDDDLFAQTQRAFVKPFDIVITAERVRDYKPSLAHFRRFAELAKPDGWVHVACSWHHDIAPAHRMGITRVWLDRDDTGEDAAIASARVRSAADVAATIASLNREAHSSH